MMSRRVTVALMLLQLAAARGLTAEESAFDRDVRPILEKRCVSCHHGENAKGELSLETREAFLKGGASGPLVIDGKVEESLLVEVISGSEPQMPQVGPKLTEREVKVIRDWVASGAEFPEGVKLTDRSKEGKWWALLPLSAQEPPKTGEGWARNPIDRFVFQKLSDEGLTPSPEADRRTLIRRLSFDLLGLPPSPEEVNRFLADERPTAYEELVDQMLSSPHYGERWGRHWLDLVHFGETHGYDKDKVRPNAWPYRDYVIESLNQDKPYSRFIREQIAGDILYPGDPVGIRATGFLAAGPWDFVGHVELREGTVDKDITRSNDRDDFVATVMSTCMSLTVHCARCHDHKFDPITQTDYYRLQAVFAGIDRGDRPTVVLEDLLQQRRDVERKITETKAAIAKAEGEKQPIEELKKTLETVEKELKEMPPAERDFVYASKPIAAPRPIHLLARGNVRSPQALMLPGALESLEGLSSDLNIANLDHEGERRAGLAEWLTKPENGLFRRSIVNRVWQYHFGRGIVDTPSDFGRMGSMPTHPELLEWLAANFQKEGESLKKLHRLIVTSATYRQVSDARPDGDAKDAGNQWLWRANRQRLDAESVRDAMLFVSGRLDLRMGGPSDRQFYFKDDHSPVYDYEKFDVETEAGARRSVYRFLVRSVPDPWMETLDCADPSIQTPKRNSTLTPLQALSLMNGKFVLSQSRHLAKRIESMTTDSTEQVRELFRITVCREPDAEELAAVLTYREKNGLAESCRWMLNGNEFLFVD